MVTKATTVIELNGINMAAITGRKFPETANDNPIRLYKSDNINAHRIILTDC